MNKVNKLVHYIKENDKDKSIEVFLVSVIEQKEILKSKSVILTANKKTTVQIMLLANNQTVIKRSLLIVIKTHQQI